MKGNTATTQNIVNVLIPCDFRAECSGNFINSLLCLAEKMKVNSFNPIFMFPFRDDGTCCNWIDYIKKYGHSVILYNRNDTNDSLTEQLLDIIDKYDIKLIHSHFSAFNIQLLWNKKIHSKVKILFHDHMDYVAERPFLPQFKKQVKTAKRYKEYGIGVVSVMKRKFRGYFLLSKRWYIPNGITYKRNVECSMTREECRKELGLKDDEKLCILLGWDIYRKGLDIGIKSILLLRQQGVNVILGIVGFGDNPSEEQINRITNVIGFDPRKEGIRFLPTFEDMYALHRSSDVYLSASRTEAFSYGILEAISQNVPVVASNISGTRWCLKYSKSIKYPTENIEKCAKAIKEAISLRKSPSNKNEITDKYNIDIWCDRVISVYYEMLK